MFLMAEDVNTLHVVAVVGGCIEQLAPEGSPLRALAIEGLVERKRRGVWSITKQGNAVVKLLRKHHVDLLERCADKRIAAVRISPKHGAMPVSHDALGVRRIRSNRVNPTDSKVARTWIDRGVYEIHALKETAADRMARMKASR